MSTWLAIPAPTRAEQERFAAKVGAPDANGCWPWLAAKGKQGHGVFHWRGRNWTAYRLALAWVQNGLNPQMHALHKCGNAPCVNPAHLYSGNQKQNSADRKRHGTFFYGGASPVAKLSDGQATEIWNAYHLTDESLDSISARTGVPRKFMTYLLHGGTWKQLKAKLCPHKIRRQPKTYGSKHWRASLTEEKVRVIRTRYDAGEKFAALAVEYGMTKAAMWRVCKRKAWPHVKD